MPDPSTAIMGGAAVLGGMQQANASGQASRAQERASKNELALQREMFNTFQQQGQAPLEARDLALAQYMSELGLPPIQARMPGQQAAQQAQPAPQPAQPVQQQDWRSQYTQVGPDAYAPIGGGPAMPGGYLQQIYANQQIAQPAQPIAQPIAPIAQPMQMFSPTAQNQLTPYENFEVSEAIKAAQMASGGQMSGRSLRALTDRTQSIAGASRENRLNRLANLAQLTSDINQQTQGSMMGVGNQMGGAMQNIGAARASGYIGRSNALTGTLQGLSGMAGYFGGMQSPGVGAGQMPLHIPTNPMTRGY